MHVVKSATIPILPASPRARPAPKGRVPTQAARARVFDGVDQPNGYTEPLLHAYRLRAKAG